MYDAQTSYVSDTRSCGGKRTYSRVLIKSSTHVIQITMPLPNFMYFIKCALDFCKVRIKLLGLTFKGKQNIFPNQQPLSSAASYLHYKATMKPIAIHSQQEQLVCMLTQQGSLAVAQVVLSFLLSILIYAFQV